MPGQPGNSGGKKGVSGRKSKAVEQDLYAMMRRAWPRRRILAAMRKQLEAAETGDLEAFKIVMGYLFGKPKEQIKHSGELEHTITIARVPPKVSKEAWPPQLQLKE